MGGQAVHARMSARAEPGRSLCLSKWGWCWNASAQVQQVYNMQSNVQCGALLWFGSCCCAPSQLHYSISLIIDNAYQAVSGGPLAGDAISLWWCVVQSTRPRECYLDHYCIILVHHIKASSARWTFYVGQISQVDVLKPTGAEPFTRLHPAFQCWTPLFALVWWLVLTALQWFQS